MLSLQQTWKFTQDWYRDRASLDWQPGTASELQAVFERNGLLGDFWQVT